MPQQRLQQACAEAGTRPCDDAAAAAQHEDGAHDGRRQDDARHMRLQHQQAHHRDEGQQWDDQLPHDALVEPFPHRDPAGRGGVELFQMGRFRGQMGREQDHLELGDLRHLNRDTGHTQPAAAAVQGRTEEHRDEHEDADKIARPDQPAQEAVVDAGEEQHRPQPQPQTEHLGLNVVEAVPHPQIARGVAGAEQHDQPEHNDDRQRRQPVDEHLRPWAGVFLDDGKRLRLFSSDGRHPHSLLMGRSAGPRRLQGQREAQQG